MDVCLFERMEELIWGRERIKWIQEQMGFRRKQPESPPDRMNKRIMREGQTSPQEGALSLCRNDRTKWKQRLAWWMPMRGMWQETLTRSCLKLFAHWLIICGGLGCSQGPGQTDRAVALFTAPFLLTTACPSQGDEENPFLNYACSLGPIPLTELGTGPRYPGFQPSLGNGAGPSLSGAHSVH